MFSGLNIKLNAKQRDQNLESLLNPDLLELSNVSLSKFDKRDFKRGLQNDEMPYPVNARIGPYEFKNPVEGAKNYYWCACGMSRKQPFCDGSHHGTKFKPIKFRLEQKADSIQLCG
jgi:CDGSH-type Zn-finger protein